MYGNPYAGCGCTAYGATPASVEPQGPIKRWIVENPLLFLGLSVMAAFAVVPRVMRSNPRRRRSRR